MFEKEAEEYREEWQNKGYYFVSQEMEQIELDDIVDATFKDGAEFGYNKANEEYEGKCKTAYIRGIRTMANALKDYDRTNGAWTDYFEHTVDNVLKKLLGLEYKNSPEKIKEIKEKYKNGVTEEIIQEMLYR